MRVFGVEHVARAALRDAAAEAHHDSELEIVDVPVGQLCGWCAELIARTDRGVIMDHHSQWGIFERPYHDECQFRMLVGSLGHLTEGCSCFGGHAGDPPGMTRREAARAAMSYWGSKVARLDCISNREKS
jgi:hypothetical protein